MKPGNHKPFPVKPLSEVKRLALARGVRQAQQFVRDYPKTEKLGSK